MKMYILVRDSVPLGLAMVGVAHASLAAYLKFRDTPEVAEWLAGPFYKAVCKVTDGEFKAARECPDHVLITEQADGGNLDVALAFKPRAEYPKMFKYLRLFKA